MAGGVRWRNRQNLERIVDLDAAMPRLLGMMTARRPGSFPFAKAVCSEGARCLLRGTAAVPSMLRDYQQFPTTDGNIEARRRTRPAWRAAVAASIAGVDPKPFPMLITVAIAATHLSYI